MNVGHGSSHVTLVLFAPPANLLAGVGPKDPSGCPRRSLGRSCASGCLSVRPRVVSRTPPLAAWCSRPSPQFLFLPTSLQFVCRARCTGVVGARGSTEVVAGSGQRPTGAPPHRRTPRPCRLAAAAGHSAPPVVLPRSVLAFPLSWPPPRASKSQGLFVHPVVP